jgi:hypothetical protein
MTVYNGFEGDPFFVGPDEPSPQLRGATTAPFPARTTTTCASVLPRWTRTCRSCWATARPAPARRETVPQNASQIEAEQPNGMYGVLCGSSGTDRAGRGLLRLLELVS